MSLDLVLDSKVDGIAVDNQRWRLAAGMFEALTRDVPSLELTIDRPSHLGSHASLTLEVLLGPQDLCWLVKYWLTNTDLQRDGKDPRLDLVDFCKRLIVGGGFNPGREVLTLPPGCVMNAPPAKEDKRERVITLDQMGGTHDENPAAVDVAASPAAVVAPVAVPGTTSVPPGPA